jgi:hypothetical protein
LRKVFTCAVSRSPSRRFEGKSGQKYSLAPNLAYKH